LHAKRGLAAKLWLRLDAGSMDRESPPADLTLIGTPSTVTGFRHVNRGYLVSTFNYLIETFHSPPRNLFSEHKMVSEIRGFVRSCLARPKRQRVSFCPNEKANNRKNFKSMGTSVVQSAVPWSLRGMPPGRSSFHSSAPHQLVKVGRRRFGVTSFRGNAVPRATCFKFPENSLDGHFSKSKGIFSSVRDLDGVSDRCFPRPSVPFRSSLHVDTLCSLTTRSPPPKSFDNFVLMTFSAFPFLFLALVVLLVSSHRLKWLIFPSHRS